MKSPLSYLPIASGFLVLVLSLAVGVLTVTSKNTNQQTTTKAAETAASFSLSPAVGDYTYQSGATYPVGIIMDSSGHSVDGVDVIINFDPKKAKVVDTKVSAATLFENVLVNSVDNVKGQIKFSGVTFNPKPLTGIVGTFRFQPLSTGTVTFTFDYIPKATTDSNIAEHGTAVDVLGNVTNGNYAFK